MQGQGWRLAVVLMLVGILLAACGGATNQQTSATSAPGGAMAAPGGGEATAAPAAGEATAAPAAGGATAGQGPKLNPNVSGTIEFWHFRGSPVRRNAIRRVIAICQQKLPNIKVNETFKPFGDIWTANIAAVGA